MGTVLISKHQFCPAPYHTLHKVHCSMLLCSVLRQASQRTSGGSSIQGGVEINGRCQRVPIPILAGELTALPRDGFSLLAAWGWGAGCGATQDGEAVVAGADLAGITEVWDEVLAVRNHFAIAVCARLASCIPCDRKQKLPSYLVFNTQPMKSLVNFWFSVHCMSSFMLNQIQGEKLQRPKAW